MEQLKTVMAIVGLVLIGFVGGFITHRQMIKKEVSKVSRLGEGDVFLRRFMDIIQPSEEQRIALDPILESHAEEMGSLMKQTMQQRRKMIQELEGKINPILETDQKERLERFHKRFRREGVPRRPRERRPDNFRRRKPFQNKDTLDRPSNSNQGQ